MTDDREEKANTETTTGSDLPAGAVFQKSLKIALPLLLSILLIVIYSQAILSPGLLDEQYLLAWLKAVPGLHGSSGFSGFMTFQGLDGLDSWGVTTRLSLLIWAVLFGKNLALFKLNMLILHAGCTLLTFLCSRRILSGKLHQ
jgi:hypothetical protein